MHTRHSLLLAGLVALLTPVVLNAADPAPGPAYQIVLRSRHAEATPYRIKDAQTGGGYVLVEQPEPTTIVVTMAGSAPGLTFTWIRNWISFQLVWECGRLASAWSRAWSVRSR
jgi:hypothetical protein